MSLFVGWFCFIVMFLSGLMIIDNQNTYFYGSCILICALFTLKDNLSDVS